jgi:hypothetical protein
VPENLIEELPATSLPADWRSIAPTPFDPALGKQLAGQPIRGGTFGAEHSDYWSRTRSEELFD